MMVVNSRICANQIVCFWGLTGTCCVINKRMDLLTLPYLDQCMCSENRSPHKCTKNNSGILTQ